MDEHVQQFMQHLSAERGVSVYTIRNYRHTLTHFTEWHQHERRAAPRWLELQRDDFRAYLRFLGRNRMSQGSTRLRFSALRSFYKFLARRGLLETSPIKNISLPKIEKFRSAKGQQIQIDHPLAKAALLHLGEIWGRSVATTELLSEAQRRVEDAGGKLEDREKQFDIARTILLQIALGSEIVELHIHQPSAKTEPSDRPRVNRLSRWQLRDANNVLTLLNKDLKINDKTSRRLMEMLDGTRTRSDLAAELKPFIERVDDLNEVEVRVRVQPGGARRLPALGPQQPRP